MHEAPSGSLGASSVRDTGIEPVTSSVSGKRATAAPIALYSFVAPEPEGPCARYWDRTSDLFRVKEARYRCANRAGQPPFLPVIRGGDGIRTRVYGFAGRCLASRPRHRQGSAMTPPSG